MNKKDQALRITAEFLLSCHYRCHDSETRKTFKTYADLCCLALPMKWRFSRQEIEAMKPGGRDE